MTRFVVQGYDALLRHSSGQDKILGPAIAALGELRFLEGGIAQTGAVKVKSSIGFDDCTFEVGIAGSIHKTVW